jgi:hypothetical protein
MKENPILEPRGIIERVQSVCLDGTSYHLHKTQGTLDHHYKELLSSAVADMVAMPFARFVQGLDPLDNTTQQVSATCVELAHMLAITFGKPFTQVEHDLIHTMKTFPADDYRTSMLLDVHKKLH